MSEEPQRKRTKTGTKAGGTTTNKRPKSGQSTGMSIPWGRIILWSLMAGVAILAWIEWSRREAYESFYAALDARVAAATEDQPLLESDVTTLLNGKTPATQVNLPGEILPGQAMRYDEYVWPSLNPALRRVARIYYNNFKEVVRIDRGG
ncbi:MAG: hypothetical protein ACKOGA_12065 [Planctomycetaceae bacterium]